MKNGFYRVTLRVDDALVVGEAQVRDGLFQGLGQLGYLKGVLGPVAANDDGSASSLAVALGSVLSELDRVRLHIEAIRLISISDREFAGKAAEYVEVARADLIALRMRLARQTKPGVP